MSNTSTASDLARPLRRSTRLNAVVPITVMGVDSYRGPYREEVSTVAVSCHGCRYESKHDVLTNSWVMLELNGKNHGTSRFRPRLGQMGEAAAGHHRYLRNRHRTRRSRQYLGHRFAAAGLAELLRIALTAAGRREVKALRRSEV